jgi:hypothetical protein
VQFGAQNAGQFVLSYSLYAGSKGLGDTSGNYLTPILFEQSPSDVREFSVIGIGASATGFGLGTTLDVPFVLIAGSAQVLDSKTFFGYLDGKVTPAGGGSFAISPNAGTISTTYPGNNGLSQYFIPSVSSLTANDALTAITFGDVGQSSRTYALQVTTPEPGFFPVLGLELSGLAILAIVAARQRKHRQV